MLKVFIADDESIIRNGLIEALPWDSLDCKVVGSAPDGKRALKSILELKPDILLTDIKMPFLDGLELIEKVAQSLPDLYIIVISGYDDFSYAQQAIKLGVYDFILKPLDLTYLENVIKSIYEDIDQKKHAHTAYVESLHKDVPKTKSRLIWELLFLPFDASVFSPHVKALDLESSYGICSIIQLDDYFFIVQNMNNEQIADVNNVIAEALKELTKDNPYTIVIQKSMREYILCLIGPDSSELDESLKKILYELHTSIEMDFGYTITATVGDTVHCIYDIKKSYMQALKSLNYKFISGGNTDIYFEKMHNSASENKLDYHKYTKLMSHIRSCDRVEAIHELREVLKISSRHSSPNLRLVACNIFFGCIAVLNNSGLNPDEVLPDSVMFYSQLMVMKDADSIFSELSTFIEKVINIIQLSHSNNFGSIISKAKQYIADNYADSKIALESVADHVLTSPCYFSYLFKKETGSTYIDYITELRINRAKELLADLSLKTYEICYLIGYDNPTYFSTLFKKRTGLTPTEYRRH